MVAGAFAFAPVEQASTVHDTVSDDLDALGAVLCNIESGGAFAEYDGVDCTD